MRLLYPATTKQRRRLGYFNLVLVKDYDPNRPQIKIMTGSLDPLGMPLATDVVPGQMADDKLYAPIISRIHSMLQKQGVLYVGDCKLSSLENRLHIKGKAKGHYLCPLPPNTGNTPEHMLDKWIDEGNLKDKETPVDKVHRPRRQRSRGTESKRV